ncbi:hypothetical protein HDV01_003476 [Terramyces sp. JEL0728]|nr:hypothetical protein HDV01_003476 [Terramyces sp. JEL0728]
MAFVYQTLWQHLKQNSNDGQQMFAFKNVVGAYAIAVTLLFFCYLLYDSTLESHNDPLIKVESSPMKHIQVFNLTGNSSITEQLQVILNMTAKANMKKLDKSAVETTKAEGIVEPTTSIIQMEETTTSFSTTTSAIETFVSPEMQKELFEMHPPQKFDWDKPPKMCVIFLSCKRPVLLERTVYALVNYMAKNEPNITYETILWDNGSGAQYIHNVIENLPIDRVISARQNVGIAYAFDQLMFHQCRSEYILSLEEDWEAQQGFQEFPLIQMSMDILDNDSKVHEVWLRADSHQYEHYTSHWLLTPPNIHLEPFIANGQSQYHRSKGLKTWGTYTNGASLKSRKKFTAFGAYHPPPSTPDGEEIYYNQFIQGFDTYSAHICMNADTDPAKRNRCDANETSIDLPPLFVHIGTYGRSPGHDEGGK